ncbi:MAG TPA: adenylate kinase [Bacteroidales bacterium]|nr:adenylate kinase [Bacteroidales bacterium]HPR57515.1 adenylate kinase [Bacteroidales bacterium]HRW97462.1 adenylate kinase [Bacteroidales bacterium]
MLNLILFGPPGSGKGTQSLKIAEKFNLAHISTGDIFRSEIKNKTELGIKVQSIIEKGDLVPDPLLIEILENALNQLKGKSGYIFDGFPRTHQQAKDLDIMLEKRNDSISLVIALDVDQNEVVKRLLNRAQLEGRKDDTEEVILNRMEVYQNQTAPLISYYKKQGKFVQVNGMGSIEEIFKSISDQIQQLQH